MRVFVCYAKQDEVFATEIVSIIRRRGMMTFIGQGAFTESRWRENIQSSSVMLYILSRAAAESDLCRNQWQYALQQGKRMIILKLDSVEMSNEMRQMNIVDYLDFAEIGRQISDGIPGLQRDRYATEVTLKMLIAELAEAQRQEAAATGKGADTAPLDEAALEKRKTKSLIKRLRGEE